MLRELNIAFQALNKVRSKIRPDRFDNKGKCGRTYEQYIQSQLIGDKLQTLRNHPSNIQHTDINLQNIITYGKNAMHSGIGYCLEQSCAVGSYLAGELGYLLVDFVTFEGCDHVFIAIGQPFAKQYPNNFAQWRDTAAICDVWTDIAYRAQDFPE